MAGEVVIDREAGVVKLVGEFENPRGLLTKIGALLLEASQAAFVEQRFGDEEWPARYGGFGDPFVNVAGLLADLIAGSKPKARRFEDRPAGRDTGALFMSLTFEVDGDEVQAGSNDPKASGFQEGDETRQFVTPEARVALAAFLGGTRERTSNERYRKRLAFLFHEPELVTKLIPRTFVGVHDELLDRIVRVVEEHLREATR